MSLSVTHSNLFPFILQVNVLLAGEVKGISNLVGEVVVSLNSPSIVSFPSVAQVSWFKEVKVKVEGIGGLVEQSTSNPLAIAIAVNKGLSKVSSRGIPETYGELKNLNDL